MSWQRSVPGRRGVSTARRRSTRVRIGIALLVAVAAQGCAGTANPFSGASTAAAAPTRPGLAPEVTADASPTRTVTSTPTPEPSPTETATPLTGYGEIRAALDDLGP
jgi:hypothetical protein